VSPDRIEAPARGGPHQLRVTIDSSCAWVSESPVAWVRFTAGAQGTGDGPVLLLVERNTGAARETAVTIAGTRVPVVQDEAD
jgi:hypothetical protein